MISSGGQIASFKSHSSTGIYVASSGGLVE